LTLLISNWAKRDWNGGLSLPVAQSEFPAVQEEQWEEQRTQHAYWRHWQ
jgi:hypothetical protein